MNKLLALTILMLGFSIEGFSQRLADVEKIAKEQQDMLDTGVGMLSTSRETYLKMDSLLNVSYNNLRRNMSRAEKNTLKTDQLGWLKKRDKYFNEVKAEYDEMVKKGEWGRDMYMVVYGQYSDYVQKRVVYLIKKRENK